jgi:hypothetical protein
MVDVEHAATRDPIPEMAPPWLRARSGQADRRRQSAIVGTPDDQAHEGFGRGDDGARLVARSG